MKLWFVSRTAFEAAAARADAEHANAQALCGDNANLTEQFDKLCVQLNDAALGRQRDAEQHWVMVDALTSDVLAERAKLAREERHVRDLSLTMAVQRSTIEGQHAELMRVTNLVVAERQKFDDLLARYHETNGRMADIAEQMTAPRPIVQGAAQPPEFNEFPPKVAGALAAATAGFRKDQKREIYEWAAAQLNDNVSADEVAATLKNGLPVTIEPEELH